MKRIALLVLASAFMILVAGCTAASPSAADLTLNAAPWKDGEKRASKLVFIGRNLDGENLQRGFNDCLK